MKKIIKLYEANKKKEADLALANFVLSSKRKGKLIRFLLPYYVTPKPTSDDDPLAYFIEQQQGTDELWRYLFMRSLYTIRNVGLCSNLPTPWHQSIDYNSPESWARVKLYWSWNLTEGWNNRGLPSRNPWKIVSQSRHHDRFLSEIPNLSFNIILLRAPVANLRRGLGGESGGKLEPSCFRPNWCL